VGPICESADFFARSRELELPEPGQYLALMDAGAYGFVAASNYNSRPRAAEVLVDKDCYRIVRRRETWNDLIRGEEIGGQPDDS
jgi:diaminopimelate decarboxylase